MVKNRPGCFKASPPFKLSWQDRGLSTGKYQMDVCDLFFRDQSVIDNVINSFWSLFSWRQFGQRRSINILKYVFFFSIFPISSCFKQFAQRRRINIFKIFQYSLIFFDIFQYFFLQYFSMFSIFVCHRQFARRRRINARARWSQGPDSIAGQFSLFRWFGWLGQKYK